MIKWIAAVMISAALFSAAPASAEASSDSQYSDRGYVAVFYPRVTIRGANQPDTGDGVGIKIGGMKANVFGGYLSAFKTRHEVGGNLPKAEFTGLTWDLKLSLPVFSTVAPFGSAGLGRYVIENGSSVSRGNQDGSGINGYQVAAGLDFHLSRLFTVSVGYTKRRMEFDKGTPGNTEIRQQIREYDAELAVNF